MLDDRNWYLGLNFNTDQSQPFFSAVSWGETHSIPKSGTPENVHASYRIVPEGCQVLLRCDYCSARHSTLIDFRSPDSLYSTVCEPHVSFSNFGLDKIKNIESLLLRDHVLDWSLGHINCELVLDPDPIPPALVPTLAQLLEDSRNDVLEGGFVTPRAALVGGQKDTLWSEISETPEDFPLEQFRLRELSRANHVNTVAAIITEDLPDALESLGGNEGVLNVIVTTENQGWEIHYPIDRFGRPAPSPGDFRPGVLHSLRRSHALADGLIVARHRHPISRKLSPK